MSNSIRITSGKSALLFALYSSLIFPCYDGLTPSDLTIEELVGQLLMVSLQAEEANDLAKKLITDVKIGGVIYYTWANGLHSPEQVAQLSADLQKLSSQTRTKIPLIIAVDHEGGRVHRFESGFTKFPPAFAFGMVNDPQLTKKCAQGMGHELRAAGITMNLAPVVDVMSNPHNPIIGTRSFGCTPELVTQHAQAFIEGMQHAGIATSIKHFPGHGDTATDSHVALPVIQKTHQELSACELAPFYALAKTADSIMTAHILVPELDQNMCSTFSQRTLDLLRNTAKFDGIIISDSLVMKGALGYTNDNLSQAALQAFKAGCDILLIGGRRLEGSTFTEATYDDIKNVHSTLLHALNSGEISRKQMEKSVARILGLKEKYVSTNAIRLSNEEDHAQLALTMAQNAQQLLKNNNFSLTDSVRETFSKQLKDIEKLYQK